MLVLSSFTRERPDFGIMLAEYTRMSWFASKAPSSFLILLSMHATGAVFFLLFLLVIAREVFPLLCSVFLARRRLDAYGCIDESACPTN